jgi:hypothetical protein
MNQDEVLDSVDCGLQVTRLEGYEKTDLRGSARATKQGWMSLSHERVDARRDAFDGRRQLGSGRTMNANTPLVDVGLVQIVS